ncbi:cadherin-like beta sandwich domain-containing protein [Paenibacillus paeoniae]|nr:cadherin-like beta sandwich domain-containing protein [Paenibacillus paeoniae]
MQHRKSRRILSGILALLLVLSVSPVQRASASSSYSVGPSYEMTGYNEWPSGMAMSFALFGGGVFDGQDIWMIPQETNQVVKISSDTGEMTGYSNWPSGFTKRHGAFSGGVFDGQHIWLIPSAADRLIKLDPATGVMTGYNDWPSGFQNRDPKFSKGIFDGTYIWLIPVHANQVVRLDPVTSEMKVYDQWPTSFQKVDYAFKDGVFDGTSIWLIPSRADQVIKLNPATGEMTGYSDWPEGYSNTGYAFGNSVFDGQFIWMLPYSANQMVRLDPATGEMTGFDQWPSGFDKSQNLFTNGTFDGEHIWTKPSKDARIFKIDPATGEITGVGPWPTGFDGKMSFNDALFDGHSVWFIPASANHVIRLTSVPALSAVTGGDSQAQIAWQPVHGATGYHIYQSLTPGAAGTEIAFVSGTENSHTVTGLLNGETYYYTVKAVYSWGESAASNEMSVTPLSSNADLSGLTLSEGTLAPSPFAAATTAYTASVDHNISNVSVTPTQSDSDATLSVSVYNSAETRTFGPESLTSGAASPALPLSVGSNRVEVTVTAPSGAEQTYTVTVTRAASGNADLSGLVLSEGTLTPSPFAAATTGYTASVDHNISNVSVTPTQSDSDATLSVSVYNSAETRTFGPESLTSGAASPELPLSVGSNRVEVTVTAPSGAEQTYTVTVTRAASGNADLSGLVLSEGTLAPSPFTPAITAYASSVRNSINSVTVTPTQSDSDATLSVSVYNSAETRTFGPESLTSGAASPALPLSVGSNRVEVTVTAPSGAEQTYTVTVTRAASGNADLSDLVLSEGTLTPSPFTPAATAYASSVRNSINSVTVTPTQSDSDATLSVSVYNSGGTRTYGPENLTSGAASPALPLSVGSNRVEVTVTAPSGVEQTYTVTVTRAASGGSGNVLSKLMIDNNGTWVDPDSLDITKASVVLESKSGDKSSIYVTLPASVLEGFSNKNRSLVIEIKTSFGSIHVPVQLASLLPELNEQLASSLVNAGDIGFKITLTDKSEDPNIRKALASQYPQAELWDTMTDFQLDMVNSRTGQTIGKADSTSQAITKLLPIPNQNSTLPTFWSAYHYEESTKTFAYAPARIIAIDGKHFAEIRSYANTIYVAGKHQVSFADTQFHWSQAYVDLAAAKGLVEGIGGGRYAPDQAVTRAEFTAMLVRALGRNTTVNSSVTPYQDIQTDAWYYRAVAEAKKLGLLNFSDKQQFQPGQAITREEMASMIAAALKLEGISGSVGASAALDRYRDMRDIDSKRLQDVRMMLELQIMTGTSGELFSPKNDITRAQAATVLIRALQSLGWINK